MAKKKNKKSEPPAAPVLNSGQTITDTTSGVMKTMPTQIGQGNTETRTQETIGILNWLLTDGSVFIDPAAREKIKSTTESLNRTLKPLTKTVARLETSITNANYTVSSLEAKVAGGATLTRQEEAKLKAARKTISTNQPKLDDANGRITAQSKPLQDLYEEVKTTSPKATDLITEKFPEAAATLAAAKPLLANMGQLGASGTALQTALNQGYQPNEIRSNDVTAAVSGQGMVIGGPSRYTPDQIQAVNAARVADVRAQQAGLGQLGNTLMGRAQTMANSTGRLTDEAARDATQATRQGFAARGMATGNAALGAELLNRDRYSRKRMFDDLGFARQIQTDDIDRQVRNAQNVLTGDMANQSTARDLSLADQRAAMDALTSNQSAGLEANRDFQTEEGRRLQSNQADQTTRDTFDAGQLNTVATNNETRALNASVADEESRRLGTQTNIGMLGDSYALDKGTNQDKLNAVLMEGGLASNANANNMLMGMYMGGQPGGTQSAGPATSAGIAAGELEAGNAWNTHNSNMWSWGQQNFGNYGNLGSSYFTGSAMGDALVTEGVGLVTDVAGGALAKSDRRMKKDIKPMGTAGGILGLPAYQYRYKNDPSNKQRFGLMAQDVKRVLPQAVREITVDGRKRLGIKPQVIGQALARELTAQSR